MVTGECFEVKNSITDYKVTSIWKVKKALASGDPEWDFQLNFLHYAAKRNGLDIDELNILAFARDWRRSETFRYGDYPTVANMIPIKIWTVEQQEQAIADRLFEHDTDQPRPCTDEERWMQPRIWKLKKKGRQKSLRNFDNEDDAVAALETLDQETHYIEVTEPEYKRCEKYCDVANWCPQHNGK